MSPSPNAPLKEWLHYIEAIHPTEIELGLDRLKKVASRLPNSEQLPFVFTVAGTNGKGTTTATLAALCQATGKRVGWYTSPHLLQFNERVKIDQIPVEDDDLVKAFSAIERLRGDISLSYFEFTTLAAFWLFRQHSLDVWVLEIGLGGRLDAVNIIDPDIAVVTNVGLDHQQFLGHDLDGIAQEKLGIARAGKPLVLGSPSISASAVEVVRQLGALVFDYGHKHWFDGDWLISQFDDLTLVNPILPKANAVTALQAFSLSPFTLSAAQASDTLNSIAMPGRLQFVNNGEWSAILDVGHNPHAAQYIVDQLAGRRFHLVLGMLQDKDAHGFVEALQPICMSVSTVTLDVPRGHTARSLAKQLTVPIQGQYDSLAQCILALTQQYPDDTLFIGGSFYTVCDALKLLES